MTPDMLDMERKVARCRVLLSLGAIIVVALDPTMPLPWLGEDRALYALAVLGAHLFYSLTLDLALAAGLLGSPRIVPITTWIDVLFGMGVALFTEGTNSPFHVFFAFAVLAAAVRGGLRLGIAVTVVSLSLYLGLIWISALGATRWNLYLMRPVYLGIVGYFAACLGRQRVSLEAKLRGLERARDRSEIARALHDGCVQALAGSNLMLEICRELVRRGQDEEALAALAELQTSVAREYDVLRTYVRDLAETETTTPSRWDFTTRFSLSANFSGSADVIEHVLHIMLEGARNIRRHAFAQSAVIGAHAAGEHIRITIDDDGTGLPKGAQAPWSITSRVNQLGGEIEVARDGRRGAHLVIAVQQA